jgi:glycogen synthase
MRVLMFGWEFPPFNTGGLGTACYGIAKGLSQEGANITFVLPKATKSEHSFLKLVASNMSKGRVKLRGIKSLLKGYITSEEYEYKIKKTFEEGTNFNLYGSSLFEEVARYGKKAAEIAMEEPHDIIHAHDWLTFEAGIAAKKASGKPLVVHVHSTEFDRTGGSNVNPHIYNIERVGLHAADAIIAVSNYTKNKIVKHYGIDQDKVSVVHNAIDMNFKDTLSQSRQGKTVLYLGRVTLQKGPDYFISAAKRVLEKEPEAQFIIAGSGDMEQLVINQASRMGISEKVMFTGFLREQDTIKAYKMASLYVMPSVSEPFGLTPLEAASNKTPVLISKQSGVSEIFNNCLQVNFWDIDDMANKIVSVLRHSELHESLTENGYREVSSMSWNKTARKCMSVYDTCIGNS